MAVIAALTVVLPRFLPQREENPLPAAQAAQSAEPASGAETAPPARSISSTAENAAPDSPPAETGAPEAVSDAAPEAVALSADGTAVAVDTAQLSDSAVFFDYDADGVTVELFAVAAPDGSARLALNTCQVCNGSPYAYFVQSGDSFVCQNCMNRFSCSQVGVVSGGCNPVPITSADYEEQDGVLSVPVTFLSDNAYRFANWKQF